jgi:hypothetical protein
MAKPRVTEVGIGAMRNRLTVGLARYDAELHEHTELHWAVRRQGVLVADFWPTQLAVHVSQLKDTKRCGTADEAMAVIHKAVIAARDAAKPAEPATAELQPTSRRPAAIAVDEMAVRPEVLAGLFDGANRHKRYAAVTVSLEADELRFALSGSSFTDSFRLSPEDTVQFMLRLGKLRGELLLRRSASVDTEEDTDER